MQTVISAALQEAQEGLVNLQSNPEKLQRIEQITAKLVECFKGQGKVISCGNGGSMCDAIHFAEELTARFRKNRPGLAAIAVSDPGFLTCAGNDFGYSEVFARYVEALGRPGDLLFCLSTSGASENVLKAIELAKSKGIFTVVLTGKDQCPVAAIADLHLATPAGRYADRIQELHIKVIHILVECVERQLFPELYPS